MHPLLDLGDLGWLASEGVWTPTYVELDYTADYQDEIETALLEFANNDNYRMGSADFTERYEVTPIYARKLAPELTQSMEDLELAQVDPGSGHWLVHRDVAAIYWL